jgi:uncharacterized protein YggE
MRDHHSCHCEEPKATRQSIISFCAAKVDCFAMLAMTFLLTMVAASIAHAADGAPVRSITTTGVAERKVVPDEAHVNVNIGASNKVLATAKAENDKKIAEVMAIAKKIGIDDAQIRTDNASIQPQYSWENNKQTFKGYRAQTSLDITVKKTELLGDLVDKLSNAGLEAGNGQEWGNLLNVNYAISNPDKIRDEMLVDAIKNARSKATNMAAAAGGSVGNVIQINEGAAPSFNFARPMPMMMARAEMSSADGVAAMAPPAGEQTVNANVTVIFELK